MNWNSGELIGRAVESIVASPPAVPYEIVVVDNASSDDSLNLLRSRDFAKSLLQQNRFVVIENQENLGFGKANNQAFELINAPFVFLLNPDAEVKPGSIDRLLQTLAADERAGACGPRILNEDGTVQPSVWRSPPAPWEIILSQLKLYKLLPRRIRGEVLLGGHWDHDRQRSVQMLSGAAILARKIVIDQVGGFDEAFHMYAEDQEWCWRIVRAGWRLIFQPDALVMHRGSRSSLKRWTKLEKLKVQLENSYLFQSRSLSRRHVIANQMANYLTATLQEAWRSIRFKSAPEISLAKQLHWRHLKKALNTRQGEGAGTSTKGGT